MKQFVIGGLDTPEKKQEAEAILKGLGYVDRIEWNSLWRKDERCVFIETYKHGTYRYHSHKCFQTPITLEDLRIKKNQEK